MHVVFIHGPAASGKHTIGSALSKLTGLPLFHNHLAVDAAKAMFAFGSASFDRMRATIWRAGFSEAATTGRSFIFTFHPEASVDPKLILELRRIVADAGGRVHFVELECSQQIVLQRLGNESRTQFGKLTDVALYESLERQGAFQFPPLPAPLLVIDTEIQTPDAAAEQIARAVAKAECIA